MEVRYNGILLYTSDVDLLNEWRRWWHDYDTVIILVLVFKTWHKGCIIPSLRIRLMIWKGEARLGWLMITMCVSGWMFLLVPAHPGCPGQNPQSRKTVVCVCMSPFTINWLMTFYQHMNDLQISRLVGCCYKSSAPCHHHHHHFFKLQ